MATVGGVYQELCAEGDKACFSRNIKRLLDALEKDVKNKIDDQSEGIAFGQKQLEQNIITNTNNKLAEAQRGIEDSVNAVHSVAYETRENLDRLEEYVTGDQKRKLDDIETRIGQINTDITVAMGDMTTELDKVSEGIGHAQDNIIDHIDSELKVSSAILQADISKHDREVIERFESIDSQMYNSTKTLNNAVERLGDETASNIQYAARGIKKETDQIVSNATSQVTSQIVAIEEQRKEDNWGIFEGVRKWIEEAFTFTPEKIAQTVMQLGNVSEIVANMMKSQNKV